ncbi:hypothetical protein OGATHE_000177 [Ogataea polymorpha]|uniref:Uncharacterized protein n=1 Tax=Ogataea polymorpha TaxID=460523 RepID=A0A9P8PVZ6_9ASCO|nr:hypothetical protein OGATHE_000177 [Ogataea polymorpha]
MQRKTFFEIIVGESTVSKIALDDIFFWRNIKLKNIHRQANGGARIWHVNDSRDVALDWRTGQQQIDLVVIVAVSSEILNDPETCLSVCDRRVQTQLFAVFVDRKALEREVSAWAVVVFYWSRQIHGTFHVELEHAFFKNRAFQRDGPGHLNCSAKRDLAISLGKMQVPDTQLGSVHVDRQVHLGPARQVLDVAVATVFRTARYGSSSLCQFGLQFQAASTRVGVLFRWQVGHHEVCVWVRLHELCLSSGPLCQDFVAGSGSNNSWMDKASKTDARDVSGGAVDALEVEHGLGSLWIVFVQKPTPVLLGEDPAVSPRLSFERLDVLDLHHQNVALLSAFHLKRPRQIMDFCKVAILDVIGRVVVPDLASRPVVALDFVRFVLFHLFVAGDLGMPSVVQALLLPRWSFQVDGDKRLHQVAVLSTHA